MNFQITPYCEHEEVESFPGYQKFFVETDLIITKNLTGCIKIYLNLLRIKINENKHIRLSFKTF